MIVLATLFLIVAALTAFAGWVVLEGATATLARVLTGIFMALFAASLASGIRRRRRERATGHSRRGMGPQEANDEWCPSCPL